MVHMNFPICQINNCGIADEFPRGCPLALVGEEQRQALQQLQDERFRRLPHDRSGEARYHTCSDCLEQFQNDPHILYLRGTPGETPQKVALVAHVAHAKGVSNTFIIRSTPRKKAVRP